jgi:hypothetical protein
VVPSRSSVVLGCTGMKRYGRGGALPHGVFSNLLLGFFCAKSLNMFGIF